MDGFRARPGKPASVAKATAPAGKGQQCTIYVTYGNRILTLCQVYFTIASGIRLSTERENRMSVCAVKRGPEIVRRLRDLARDFASRTFPSVSVVRIAS